MRFLTAILSGLLLFMTAALSLAEASSTDKNSETLADFFDEEIKGSLQKYNTLGLAVTVVDKDSVLFSKGYGLHDNARRRAIDPDMSLFRVASVSKLFTWTAIMQLVEKGKLSLEDDVNLHLNNFSIPNTFDRPVTIFNLLTHTAGFEDHWMGLMFLSDPKKVKPLEEVLAEYIPRRIWPAGHYSAYSNYGTSLAGLIVQNISGMPFQEYVTKYIFSPLKMANSSFREPIPLNLKGYPPIAYKQVNGVFEEGYFEFNSNIGPAGSLTSSAADMARFMMANLNGACLDGRCLMKEATLNLMHSRSFAHHPSLNGWTLGFMEKKVGEHRMIYHDGDSNFFHTMLTLDKTDGTGLFLAVNTDEGGELIEDLTNAYYKRFVPVVPPHAKKQRNPDVEFANYEGTFRVNRLSQTNFEKLLGLIFELSVSYVGNNKLEISSLGSRYTVTPKMGDYFSNEDDSRRIAFSRQKGKRVDTLFLNDDPSIAFFRIPWYESRVVHLAIWFITIAVAAGTLLRFLYHNFNFPRRSSRESVYLKSNTLISALQLTFFGALLYTIVVESNRLFNGPTLLLQLASTAILISVPLLAWAGWLAVRERSLYSGLRNSVRSALLILQVLFISSLHYWKLLGYQS